MINKEFDVQAYVDQQLNEMDKEAKIGSYKFVLAVIVLTVISIALTTRTLK